MGDQLAIPKHLKAKEWDSHKGIIAKLVKDTRETGITKALKAFEDYYKFQGYWGLWGDSEIEGNLRLGDAGVRQLQTGLDTMAPFLSGLQPKLELVRTLAAAAALKFKQSKVIPSSSREYLEEMARKADTFYDQVKRNLEDSERKIKETQKKARAKK
jgi:hypothetical protein